MRLVWKDWLSRLRGSKPGLTVIEIEDKIVPVVEDEESIRSLKEHPGFVMLMNRLKIQKNVLNTVLRRETHSSLRRVQWLQSGIHWLEYLQNEVDKAVAKKREVRAVAPSEADMALYEQAYSLIQGV